jgi:hypothetical protein
MDDPAHQAHQAQLAAMLDSEATIAEGATADQILQGTSPSLRSVFDDNGIALAFCAR